VRGGTAVQLDGAAPLHGKHSVGTPPLPPVVPVAPPVVPMPPVATMPPAVSMPPVATMPPVVPIPPMVPVAPAPPAAATFKPDEQAVDIAAATTRPRHIFPANEARELVMPENLQNRGYHSSTLNTDHLFIAGLVGNSSTAIALRFQHSGSHS
jgi:hypothetical protein